MFRVRIPLFWPGIAVKRPVRTSGPRASASALRPGPLDADYSGPPDLGPPDLRTSDLRTSGPPDLRTSGPPTCPLARSATGLVVASEGVQEAVRVRSWSACEARRVSACKPTGEN